MKKNTDDRSLIWRTDRDKRGLPLEGFAVDCHFTFYFAGLKANIHAKSTEKLLKVLNDVLESISKSNAMLT